MTLPQLVRKHAEKILGEYCREWRPTYSAEPLYLTYEIEGDSVTLLLQNPAASPGEPDTVPMAQLRYSDELRQWTLHVPDSSGRWKLYLNARPTLNLPRLLRHLKEDPLGFFRY